MDGYAAATKALAGLTVGSFAPGGSQPILRFLEKGAELSPVGNFNVADHLLIGVLVPDVAEAFCTDCVRARCPEVKAWRYR
jgi:hypothetical protein